MIANIHIQIEDFDVADEIAALSEDGPETGAVASFVGMVRGGDDLTALTLEHYPGMAEEEIARHVAEAESRWPLLGVTVIHRYGRLVPGDNIVLVVTASSHRADAFAAAEFLMDYLKTRAPFWKQEERGAATQWIEAKVADDELVQRWMPGRPDAAE